MRAQGRRVFASGSAAAIGEREGVRWLVEKLGGGVYRLTLEQPGGRYVQHTGTPANIAARLGIDASAYDKSLIQDDITLVG